MITIHTVPCLTDNYAYIIQNQTTNELVLVDVPEAAPIKAALAELGGTLRAVLITHHHDDHVQGLALLNIGEAQVYGGKRDVHRLPKLDVVLADDATFSVAGMDFQTLPADGHTIGHIAFYLAAADALFSADSLMHWGCGRLFEGTPDQMWQTLERFMALPDATMIYSGHNYAVGNGKFALSLIDDAATKVRWEKISDQNAAGEPVVPVSMIEEKTSNPFLRVIDDHYARAVGIDNLPVNERFAELRRRKDKF